MRQSILLSDRIEAEARFPGDRSIKFAFNPKPLTPRFETSNGVTACLLASLLEWDLQDDAGEPWPLTEEGLLDLHEEIQQVLYGTLCAARLPNLIVRSGDKKSATSS